MGLIRASRALFVAVTGLMFNVAQAYPGHYSMHWTSPAILAVLSMSLVIMVAIGIWDCHQNRKMPAEQQTED